MVPQINEYVTVIENETMNEVGAGALVTYTPYSIRVAPIEEYGGEKHFDAKTHHILGYEPPKFMVKRKGYEEELIDRDWMKKEMQKKRKNKKVEKYTQIKLEEAMKMIAKGDLENLYMKLEDKSIGCVSEYKVSFSTIHEETFYRRDVL